MTGAGVLGALAWPAAALAQAPTLPELSLERLQLNPGAADSLVADGALLLAPGTLRLGLTGHYEHAPLEYARDGELRGDIVGSRYTAHLTAAWAPTAWLELGAQLPFVVHQEGDPLEAFGVAQPASSAVGDPQLQVRVAPLRQAAGAPLDLALGMSAQLPVSARDALTREGTLRPSLSVGHTLGTFLRAGAELGLVLRHAVDFQGTSLTRSAVEGSALLHTVGGPLRGELALRAALPTDGSRISSELLGGGRYRFAQRFEAYALAGAGLSRTFGTPTFRGLAGLALLLDTGGGSRAEPAPAQPEPARCEAGQPHRAGECPALDDDGDGVANGQDACPSDAGPAQGCPVKDADGDSVEDAEDRCPSEAGTRERQGCPMPTAAPAPSEDAQQQRAAAVADIERQVCLFATGSSTLTPECRATLEGIARTLAQHEDLRFVVVEGYASSEGPPALNRRLSQERAEAVRRYLLQRGVAPGRLEPRGFGSERPEASDDSAEGRRANRRVRLTVQGEERGR